MKNVVILLLLFSFQKSFSDQARIRHSFKSKNGYFELKPSDTIFSSKKVYKDSIYNSKTKQYDVYEYTYSDTYVWSLYDIRNNKKLYTLKNSEDFFIESKTALISDNGKNIIIVDDYSGGNGLPSFEVIHFYNFERLVKILALKDLISNSCSITYSVSHMRWQVGFGFTKKNTFRIETNELYKIEYDLNGNLINKKSDIRIKKFDDIVSSEIKRIKKDKYLFKIRKSIRGKYKVDEIITLNVSDKTMRKIHGKFYGFLPSRNKKMENKFIRTFLFRNNKPIISDIFFPNYNANKICNIINQKFK